MQLTPKSTYGMKFCSTCRRWIEEINGKAIVSKDKLSYKWKCNSCIKDNHG